MVLITIKIFIRINERMLQNFRLKKFDATFLPLQNAANMSIDFLIELQILRQYIKQQKYQKISGPETTLKTRD